MTNNNANGNDKVCPAVQPMTTTKIKKKKKVPENNSVPLFIHDKTLYIGISPFTQRNICLPIHVINGIQSL